MSSPIGAEFSAALLERLDRAFAEKGPGYRPRAHHLEGQRPRYTNRLILESSPYLLQHAHNPVNWFAWSDEAFAEARRLDRPVLLSVGYATCHWCHVMERESFEDEEVARFMNEHCVCIKVDREERPDVDAIYMNAVQQLHGSGGWPMTVWLTPDQKPFFAGTYFPARDGDRGMQRGFLSLLAELDDVYRHQRARVDEAASSLTQAVRESLGGAESAAEAMPSAKILDAVASHLLRALDPLHGGTRGAPKFPSSMPVRLLLRHHARTGDANALHAATSTLEHMAAGGIYDQLAGGFHRYAVDAQWLVPHFEKMLYDNALLAIAYCEAHQVTGRADFARVAEETLAYLQREMTAPEGGFYSATDADSEGEEGKFFVWSEQEIRSALGEEAPRFIAHYGVTPGGNFEGENILFVPHPDEAEHAALAAARAKLYALRAKRIPPLRDDKILAAWNGLAISAFAVGGRVLRRPELLEAASRAASFVLEKMRVNGRLMRSYKDGRARLSGYLADHAFVIAGLVDLYEASFERRWLAEAVALAGEVEAHFADADRGGWFMTADDHEVLLAREKPNYDGAEPSGTSVQVLNLLRLAELTQAPRWRESASRALTAFAQVLSARPLAMSELLLALDFASAKAKEIVLVWPDGARLPDELAEVLAKTFVRARVIAGGAQGELAALAQLVPLVEGKDASAGATAYVCVQGACQLPAHTAAELRQQLASP